ncbi:MAG: hypothetical protein OEZ41_04995, partial [Nitrospirota bacterium]|nr:hypothetical protein [Nitrospirota bacterium]
DQGLQGFGHIGHEALLRVWFFGNSCRVDDCRWFPCMKTRFGLSIIRVSGMFPNQATSSGRSFHL